MQKAMMMNISGFGHTHFSDSTLTLDLQYSAMAYVAVYLQCMRCHRKLSVYVCCIFILTGNSCHVRANNTFLTLFLLIQHYWLAE